MSERRLIVFGSDAAGYELKETLREHVESAGLPVADKGTHSEAPVDYPDFARAVALEVAATAGAMGILICGTGIGMSIAANKWPGIRAALCHDSFGAEKSRAHNDANILTLGAWDVTPERAREIVDVWLAGKYEGGRHLARLQKLELLDVDKT